MLSPSLRLLSSFLALSSTVISALPALHHGAKVAGIGVPITNSDASGIIANRYIVVYKNNATDAEVATHQASVMTKMRRRGLEARGKDGRKLSAEIKAFSMSGWRGMTIDAEDGMILEIESAREVWAFLSLPSLWWWKGENYFGGLADE